MMVKIRRLSEEEGGGYLATIPPWESTYIADGETEEEAVQKLQVLCDEINNEVDKQSKPRSKTSA